MANLFSAKTTIRVYALLLIVGPVLYSLAKWKTDQPAIDLFPLFIDGCASSVPALLALLLENPFKKKRAAIEVPK